MGEDRLESCVVHEKRGVFCSPQKLERRGEGVANCCDQRKISIPMTTSVTSKEATCDTFSLSPFLLPLSPPPPRTVSMSTRMKQ